jgi:hypothetical protein
MHESALKPIGERLAETEAKLQAQPFRRGEGQGCSGKPGEKLKKKWEKMKKE